MHGLGVQLRNSTALAERFHPMLQDLLHTGPYPSIDHILQLTVEYAGCTHYCQFLDKYYPERDVTRMETPTLIQELLRQARRDWMQMVAVDIMGKLNVCMFCRIAISLTVRCGC